MPVIFGRLDDPDGMRFLLGFSSFHMVSKHRYCIGIGVFRGVNAHRRIFAGRHTCVGPAKCICSDMLRSHGYNGFDRNHGCRLWFEPDLAGAFWELAGTLLS